MRFLAFFILFLSFESFSCSFKNDLTYISFSGPTTRLLKELELLKDDNLKAISSMHGISKEDFKGEFLGGGLFFSPKLLKKYKNSILFFDSSIEQKRLLSRLDDMTVIELKGRGLDPFEMYELTKKTISPFIKNCEDKIAKLDEKIEKIKAKVLSSKKEKGTVVFYLGGLYKYKKKPTLVINRDGFVLFLLNNGKIKSYPSELAYVPWSEKILKEMTDIREYGIVSDTDIEFKKLDNNIYSSTALIPGITQIYFLENLLPL